MSPAIHTFAILAYKKSPYLNECIASLKHQNVPSELFIATSTPSAFLESMSKKYTVPLLVNNNKGGIAHDWNFAYEKCVTKYCTLAHQDDIYLPDYTRLCLAAAERAKDNLLIFPDYYELVNNKRKAWSKKLFIKRLLLLPYFLKPSIAEDWIRRATLSFGTPIQCSSVMYHKEHIGTFSFSEEYLCNLDWDAWLRLCQKKGSFVRIKKKLMFHRIHAGSESAVQIAQNVRQKEDALMFERLWPKPIAGLLSKLYAASSRITHDMTKTKREEEP